MKTMIFGVAALFSLGIALTAGNVSAADLKVGDKAPDFTLKASDGKTYSLSDFKGKKGVVIAWFPKAFTGGCTVECKSLQINSSALKATNVAYFTASVDPVDGAKGNKAFAESLGLDYPILSDPEKTTAKAYGVLNTAGMSSRVTFYIDKEGVIREIDKSVNTKKDQPEAAGRDVVSKIKSSGIGG